MSIFKAYDVRGIYPTELDENLARKIGAAFVKGGPVVDATAGIAADRGGDEHEAGEQTRHAEGRHGRVPGELGEGGHGQFSFFSHLMNVREMVQSLGPGRS